MTRSFYYIIAVVLSILAIIYSFYDLWVSLPEVLPHTKNKFITGADMDVFILAFGGFFAVYFGWRNDRRHAKLYKLQIQQLELQIKELSEKLEKGE